VYVILTIEVGIEDDEPYHVYGNDVYETLEAAQAVFEHIPNADEASFIIAKLTPAFADEEL
jgi:hypothetical protein